MERPDSRTSVRLQRRLLHEAPGLGVRPATLALLTLALAVAIILQMALLGGVLARAATGTPLAALYASLALLLAAISLRAILQWWTSVVAREGAIAASRALRLRLFDHTSALGPVYLAGERTGELVNTATEGVDRLEVYFSAFVPQAIQSVLIPAAVAVFVLWIDPLSGLVLLVTGPLIPLFMWLIGTWAERRTQEQWSAMSRMSAHFLDVLQGLPTLKLFGRTAVQAERIHDVSDRFRRATMHVLRVAFLSGTVLELLASVSIALVAVQAGVRLIEGLVTFDIALTVLVLAPEFYLPFRRLGAAHHAGMEGIAAAARIFHLLDQRATVPIAPPHSVAEADTGHILPRLVFENVSYTYPGRTSPALSDVSFEVRPGETLALVGATGAGKSTIAALALGFIQPTRGKVRVDGQPVTAADIGESWRRIAYVPQHPHLFEGTLRSNLKRARASAGDDEILHALEAAGLRRLVDEVEGGLDARVGEQGVTLSGGQRQRVALARAFLKDAPLVILDEPTAHLDPELEAELRAALQRLLRNRTVLLITHRLSTAARADQVLVLEAGRVAEMGTPDELMRRQGRYAQLQQPVLTI